MMGHLVLEEKGSIIYEAKVLLQQIHTIQFYICLWKVCQMIGHLGSEEKELDHILRKSVECTISKDVKMEPKVMVSRALDGKRKSYVTNTMNHINIT